MSYLGVGIVKLVWVKDFLTPISEYETEPTFTDQSLFSN